MELSLREYPGMLTHLPPGQAVKLLNDRVKYINRLNGEIADWLQERRRIEEQYAQSLRRLAGRQFPDDISELGIFSTPWNKIITSTETLAQSHHMLAQNLGQDVEMPLREFATGNREMQAMATITGNIQSIGKEVETAQKKSDKLKDKGGKAAAGKVANAASDVENAQGQWDSQAPYVFERLQAVDEARVNHLRNVLTQYQTHIIESGSAMSNSAEECLNALLNVQTEDEIKTFAMKTTRVLPTTSATPAARRRMSRAADSQTSTPTASSSLAPLPPMPRQEDELSSQRSSSFQEKDKLTKGFGGGLKRLGTVIGRKRQSVHPYAQSTSPERKKSASNLGSAFGRFGRRESHQNLDRQLSPPGPERRPSSRPSQSPRRPSDAGPSPILERTSSERPNGTAVDTNGQSSTGLGLMNGTQAGSPSSPRDPKSLPSMLSPSEPLKDSEGFSVPTANSDPIQQALKEAAETNESTAPQFKVDIRNAPIEEESGDASAALANVANALQAQAAPARRLGTVRGRRDRNTIILPNSQIPEVPREHSPATSNASSAPPLASPTPPLVVPSFQSTPPSQTLPSPQGNQSPWKLSHRSTLGLDDTAASDTQSIRSGRSLSSSASTTIRHPEMHAPGLNTSVVETLSAWFSNGQVTRAILLGELALVYNPANLNEPFGTEIIRLENFTNLEKVAPNPAFIDAVPEKSGEYTVNLSPITKTSVAFKYQVHLAGDSIASHAPLLLKPAWKVEPTQTSVILSYSMNPSFAKTIPESQTSLTMSNVIILIHLDASAGKATSCKAMGGGSFARERNLVYWKLGDITLSASGPAQTLRARFLTDGEAKPGNVEARWEIGTKAIASLGSGLSVSKLETVPATAAKEEADDPFADDSVAAPSAPSITWKEINIVRKRRSGTYLATS